MTTDPAQLEGSPLRLDPAGSAFEAIDAIGGSPAGPRAADLETVFVSAFFDAESYLALYPDLRDQQMREGEFGPETHFRHHGIAEGRSPSVLFDVGWVAQRLAKERGIELAGGDATFYYIALPAEQRFVPNRWFNAWAFRHLYAARYALLQSCSDYEAFEFYVFYGSDLRLSPNGLFNEESYLARYRDVAEAVASGAQRSGFMHFVSVGCHDARFNIPGFRARNASGPLDERAFLLRERSDLQAPVAWFDEAFYLAVHPDAYDLKRRGHVRSGFEHFMLTGFAEGRLPHPASRELLLRAREAGTVASWAFAEEMAGASPLPDRIDLAEARRVLAHVAPPPDRLDTVRAALWDHIAPPAIGGVFDARAYLAVNVDVAEMFGGQDLERAAAHWREHGLREGRAAVGTNLFVDRTITLADAAAWKSGVNFFGPLSASSGLGEACRGMLAALRHAGIPVEAHDVSVLLRADMAAAIFSADDLAYSINFFMLNADQVIPFAARYGTAIFDHRANVGAWVWELPSPRPEWRAALSAFDLIIVPSAYCAASFEVATERPVRVVPYLLSAAELRGHVESGADDPALDVILAAKAAGRRIVLFVMDASSYVRRKGLDLFLALAERIGRSDPGRCLFVLKTHSRDVSGATSAIAESGDLLVIDKVLPFPTLCRLRAMADIYVSPHRSEGFGLNIFESVMLGVKTVCSAYAGGIDRLGADYPYLVGGRIAEIGRDMGPYAAHATWFEPDPDDLEAKFRRALDEPAPPAFHETSRRLAEELSLDAVASALRAELAAHCALGAEEAPDALARFLPLSRVTKEETFRVGHVTDSTARTPSAPGLPRLGEIVMGALTPFFSIVTPVWNSEPSWLDELYDDLLQQSFPSWEWCIADDASTRDATRATLDRLRRRDARIKITRLARNGGISAATNAAVAIATGRFVVMVDHDDRVSPELLASYAGRLREGRDPPELLYCDEDKLDPSGQHRDHYFKPDWSPEHATSCMYVLHCLAIRKSRFLELGGYRTAFDGAQDYDFLLRAASACVRIGHVDRILYHWRISAGSAAATTEAKSDGIAAGRRALEEHLARAGLEGHVEHGAYAGTYRVRPRLPDRKVALLILTGMTRNPAKAGGRSYAENFVRSILRHLPPLELEIRVVVDAPAAEAAAELASLDPRVRIVPYEGCGGGFNFSHKANFAVRSAGTDRVVLLNDDMEAESDCWLPALLEMLEIPGVGLVGGKLLYGDGRIQHCGIAMGVMGACTHLFAGLPAEHGSYNLFAHVIRNYSAVTGAMLAFRRSVFERAGGFDELFPIDYNDIDFCMRVQEAGLRVVYTPFAELRHYESRSAVRFAADELDTARFTRRWAARIARDPFYNANLTRTGVMCEAAASPG